jgi:hypothetical protein
MKLLNSILVSVNIHVWLVVGLSAVWALTKPEPVSQASQIEVQFFKISAAEIEGLQKTVASRTPSPEWLRSAGKSKDIKAEHRHSVMVLDGTHTAKTGSPTKAFGDDKKVISKKTGPSVEYKVSLAKNGSYARYKTLPTLHVVAGPVDFADQPGASGPGNAELPEYGGDIRPRLDIIQAKIDAVTPLMHRTSTNCWSEGGIVMVKFSMNHEGYPTGHRIVRSSGSNCLDKEVDTVLHMAEPYPFVAGWVPVAVKFTL